MFGAGAGAGMCGCGLGLVGGFQLELRIIIFELFLPGYVGRQYFLCPATYTGGTRLKAPPSPRPGLRTTFMGRRNDRTTLCSISQGGIKPRGLSGDRCVVEGDHMLRNWIWNFTSDKA